MNIQSTTEDTRECQNVVDLVRVVGTTGTDNSSACFFCQSRVDFWSWVCTSKDDWVFCHGLNHLWGQNARSGNADKYVCTADNVSQRACAFFFVGNLGHLNLNVVETVASFVDCTLAVAEDCICNACGEQQLGDCDSSCTCAADYNVNVLDVLANYLQSIDKTCQGNDCGTVLIIMEDRNVADFFEFAFNIEALWSFDVLEVYAAEGWLHHFNSFDDLVRIFGIQADWESIYACKGFEQNSLTFHNRHTCACTDVAQTQYSSTVGYNSNQIAFCGIFINFVIVLLNLQTWLSYTWGICQRQVFCTTQLYFAFHSDFALRISVQFKGFFINVHFRNPPYDR